MIIIIKNSQGDAVHTITGSDDLIPVIASAVDEFMLEVEKNKRTMISKSMLNALKKRWADLAADESMIGDALKGTEQPESEKADEERRFRDLFGEEDKEE